MKDLLNKSYLFVIAILLFASCSTTTNSPGLEYAPDMYHSMAYDPLSQVTDSTIGKWRGDREDNKGYYNSNTLNPHRMNMRLPVKGTVARRNYTTTFGEGDTAIVDLMVYNIHKDSMSISERILKNPVPLNAISLAEGEQLYINFCSHCHGKDGKADGKVADKYKGVPAYNSAGLKFLNDGHIYHTITYGKGLMWPHGSQISPIDRWKIVHYVHKLQQQ